MACADTKIEEARETVRAALQGADCGCACGEDRVVAMAAAPAMHTALMQLRATLRLAKAPNTEWTLQALAANLEVVAEVAIARAEGRL